MEDIETKMEMVDRKSLTLLLKSYMISEAAEHRKKNATLMVYYCFIIHGIIVFAMIVATDISDLRKGRSSQYLSEELILPTKK